MERHQLEDRIRASLQARAEDVAPTPELWERVSERSARRARWTLGLWALSGAAAVVIVVFGGMALLDNPRHIEIQPGPEVADTPETAPTPTRDATPAPTTTSGPTIVTSDGQLLYEVDPTTGEVVRELDPFEGFAEGAEVREVAVRPAGDDEGLTVASVIEIEGMFDVEVSVFDEMSQRVDRQRIGMAAPDVDDLPPDLVWSQDGRYLMWGGTSLVDGETAGPALWAYDWVERPLNSDGVAEPFAATAPGADGALFEAGGTVDLREWTGAPDGQSGLVATTASGGAHHAILTHVPRACEGTEPCPPTWEVQISELVFEGASPMDLGTLANGVNLALVVPTAGEAAPDGDAEGATLALFAEPMSDQQRRLEIPELTDGTAAPLDAWMAVAGNRIAVGFGDQQAHLLTVTGDTVEELEVTATVPLPDGTQAAALAHVGQPAPPPEGEVASATPTEGPPEETAPAIGDDGVPTHVIAGGPDELQLVDRRSPDQPLVTIGRPDGIDSEMAAGEVVVHPESTADDLQFVTTWVAGESQVLARTVVREGEVVANEVMDEPAQPDNTGGAAETAHSVPVFSPDGRWLAWVETPDGGAGPTQVRIVEWVDGQAEGPGRAVTAPAEPMQPFQLLDWARTSEGDVLTMAPAVGPGPNGPGSATMVELTLQVTGTVIAETTDDDWRFVDLPGALFDAGSYPFEEGTQRYIVFDGGDEVMYALAESPDTAVETGALPFSEGRVMTFGPDSALVQRPDGAWQRVQVDTGAASPVEVPEGTRALLPWRD